MPRSHRRFVARLALLTTLSSAAIGASAFAPAPIVAGTTPTAMSGHSDVSEPGDLEIRVEDGRQTVTGNGFDRRSGLRAGSDVLDLSTWVAAAARRVEALGLPTVTLACDIDCAEDEPGEGAQEFAGAGSIGDLDGDGRDEVLVERFTLEEDGSSTNATQILDGVTGDLLWEVVEAESFGFTAQVPDVGGGDGPDVLRITYAIDDPTFSEDCTPIRCSFGQSVAGVGTMVLRDGVTGEQLRRSEHPYEIAYEEGVAFHDLDHVGGVVADAHLVLRDDLYWLAPVDRDGDGTHELVTTAVDVRVDDLFGAVFARTPLTIADLVAAGAVQVARTRTELVDVDTDTVTSVHDSNQDGRWVFTTPLDPGEGLLLEASPSALALGILCGWSGITGEACGPPAAIAVPGAVQRVLAPDLSVRWETPMDDAHMWTIPAGGDLDGDGTPDLFETRVDRAAHVFSTALLSGADGHQGWVAATGQLALRSDGLVGTDIAVGETGDDTVIEALALRLDPTTGAVTDSRTIDAVTLTAEDEFVFALMGVGLTPVAGPEADVMSNTYVERYGTSGKFVCEQWEDPDSGEVYEECYEELELLEAVGRFRVTSGADLTALAEVDTTDQSVTAVVDLDGDDVGELLTLSFGPQGEVVRALDLAGATLWRFVVSDESIHGLAAAGDGSDVITVQDTTVRLRDGVDLTERWAR